jgi:hypothetical protein
MATRDDQKRLIKLARIGKLDGDDGFKVQLAMLVKSGFVGEDLDYNEKPYFRSALWEASWKNYRTMVELLVDKKANLQHQDFQKRTPLHEAAYYGHMDLITYFLEKGHPIDCKDDFGQTPLFRACEGNRMEVIEYLIQRKAEPNLLDSDSTTISHSAGFQGLAHNAEWLLYHGAWKNRYCIQEPGPLKPPVHEWSIGSYPDPTPPAADPPAPALEGAAASSDVFVTDPERAP